MTVFFSFLLFYFNNLFQSYTNLSFFYLIIYSVNYYNCIFYYLHKYFVVIFKLKTNFKKLKEITNGLYIQDARTLLPALEIALDNNDCVFLSAAFSKRS